MIKFMNAALQEIAKATQDYPRFPDGRIDYTHQRVCYVVNCVVVVGGEVLLARRSEKVGTYPNSLNGISGYIDDTSVELEQLARSELQEELGAPIDDIANLVVSDESVQVDEELNKEWHVYAVLVEFAQKFEPKVNWENKTAEWYPIHEAKGLDLMPFFGETLDTAMLLRKADAMINT